MIDFERLNELIYSFRITARNKKYERALPVRKDSSDVLRVRFWYEGLKIRSRLNSAYKLEQYFEPESFKKSDGIASNRCKWQRYASGRHIPQDSLVTKVELKVPGSRQELEHPLWAVIRRMPSQATISEEFLKRLKPDVQAALFEPIGGVDVYWQRVKTNSVLLAKLERIASLDALAGLTWLLRESLIKGQRKVSLDLVRSIYDVLLMSGVEWQSRGLASPLLEHFAKNILTMTAPMHLRFHMSERQMFEASSWLNLVVYQTAEGKKLRELSWRQRVRIMRKLLAGNTGYDIVHAVSPVYVPDATHGEVPHAVIADLFYAEKCRAWGQQCLLSGAQGKFPPAEFRLFRRKANLEDA